MLLGLFSSQLCWNLLAMVFLCLPGNRYYVGESILCTTFGELWGRHELVGFFKLILSDFPESHLPDRMETKTP